MFILNSPFHKISIHALRVEGDIEHVTHEDGEPIISIHALRVEGDSSRFKR